MEFVVTGIIISSGGRRRGRRASAVHAPPPLSMGMSPPPPEPPLPPSPSPVVTVEVVDIMGVPTRGTTWVRCLSRSATVKEVRRYPRRERSSTRCASARRIRVGFGFGFGFGFGCSSAPGACTASPHPPTHAAAWAAARRSRFSCRYFFFCLPLHAAPDMWFYIFKNMEDEEVLNIVYRTRRECS